MEPGGKRRCQICIGILDSVLVEQRVSTECLTSEQNYADTNGDQMIGVIVNAVAVLVGGALGLLLKKGIPQRFSGAIMTGIGLCVLMIGISGALQGENLIILVVSIVLGVITGTALKLDDRLTALGDMIEKRFNRAVEGRGKSEDNNGEIEAEIEGEIEARIEGGIEAGIEAGIEGEYGGKAEYNHKGEIEGKNTGNAEGAGATPKYSISQGFVSASLLFCVGAMAIIGSINSGLTGDHSIVYTKSVIDLISAAILAASLGLGVLFSAVAILLYQGLLVLLAQFLRPLMDNPSLIAEIGCAGSVLIIGLGLNLISITKIKVADFLPAIVFVPIVYTIARLLSAMISL